MTPADPKQPAYRPEPKSPESAVPATRMNDSSPPSVLVLLASYNGAKWIHAQITSILAQRDVDLKILVRDDGSCDETLHELAKFTAAPVRLAPSSRPTGSAAQNFFTMIRENAANGFDLIAFSDQDDVWNDDKLARAYRLLRTTGAAAYSSATTACWENGRHRLIPLSGLQTASDFLFEGAGQGCTFVLTSNCYERLRAFLNLHPRLTEGIHFHDWAIYALTRSWDLQWIFDPKPSMIYRQHPGNDTGARGNIRGILKRLTLIRNGWYGKQLANISSLCATAAPHNTRITNWNNLLSQQHGFMRNIRSAAFCLKGGRRRMLDNTVVFFGSLAGWI